MATGIVRDDSMWNAVMGELPGGQRSPLVARTGLVDPDMDADAAVVSRIDRRRRRTKINRRKPAGVAVGQHVDALARPLAGLYFFDQGKAVLTDALVDRDVFLGDFAGADIG